MIKLEHFYDTATTPIDVLKFVPSTLEESFFSFELMMMLVVGVELEVEVEVLEAMLHSMVFVGSTCW